MISFSLLLPISDGIGLITRFQSGTLLKNDDGYQIARALKAGSAKGETIFLNRRQIIYWLVEAELPTNVVHPSNLSNEGMVRAFLGEQWSTNEELQRIFEQRSKYIVPDPTRWFFTETQSVYIREQLIEHYELSEQIGRSAIYALKS